MVDWSGIGNAFVKYAGPTAAIGGLGMGLFSNLFNRGGSSDYIANSKALAEHSAKLNYDYSLKYAENSPSAQRAGLEAAGYNPMLAVSNGAAGSASTFASTPSAGSYDYNSKAVNALSLGRLANEVKAVRSQAQNLDEQTKTNSINNWWLPLQKSLEYDQSSANIENTKANTDLQIAQTTAQMITNEHLPDRLKAEISNLFSGAVANLQYGNALESNAYQTRLNSEQERKWYGFNHIAGPVLGGLGVVGGLYSTRGKVVKPYGTRTINYDPYGTMQGYTDRYNMYD